MISRELRRNRDPDSGQNRPIHELPRSQPQIRRSAWCVCRGQKHPGTRPGLQANSPFTRPSCLSHRVELPRSRQHRVDGNDDDYDAHGEGLPAGVGGAGVLGVTPGDAVAPELEGMGDALGEATGVNGGEGVPRVDGGEVSGAERVELSVGFARVVVPGDAAGTVSGAAGSLTYPPAV
jgi:hypothetical protein